MPFYAGEVVTTERLGNVIRHSTTPSLQAFWDEYSGTTTAAGFLTVTHNAGFTPSVAVITGNSPNSATDYTGNAVVSSITSTSFTVRFLQNDGTALNAVAVEFFAFLGE